MSKIMRHVFPALLLMLATAPLWAESLKPEPFVRELQLIYVFEGAQPEFLLVIGQSGFKSVAALQEHLKTWPPGSELKWAPGCLRFGGEPLLSSDKEMQTFKAFLDAQKIKWVLVPSG